MSGLFDLTGRVAIVTGGNGGLGLAMAEGLAEHGAEIAIVGRNPEKNRQAAERLRATGREPLVLELDVLEAGSAERMVEETVKHFGRLDILLCNAGGNIRKRPEEYTDEEFQWVIDLDLVSIHRQCRAAYPHLRASGRGRIIVIGSIMSHLAAPFNAPYCAAKGGLAQLARAYATAWAQDGIRVNAILPGWFDTDLTRRARAEVPGLDERVRARVPLGRWGQPHELKGAAVFLAGDAAEYVTGAAIAVDGGVMVAA